MKRFTKTLISLILLVGCLPAMSGCFDRRELDTLGIVLGVALDKGENEGEMVLTVQMANPVGGESSKGGKSSKGGEGGKGGASKPFLNMAAAGKNINTIIREMQHKMSRRIYVAHSQVIVISEDLAKQGVRDSLDFFARAPEARMTLNVFVARGKAGEVLEIDPEFEKVPSTELMKILKDQKITSHVPIVTEFEFVTKLISKTSAAVAPLVELTDDNGQMRMKVSGCAVFKESVMTGTFDDNQARGMLFVLNKVKTGVMETAVKDTTATIEIREAKCKVKPTLYSDGTVAFDINIYTTVGLGDQTGTFNLADPDNTSEMLTAAAKEIKNEVQSAVDKSKELGADVFGFGEYLNRKYPDQWKSMQNKWDEQYKNIKVNISVNAKADGSGRIVKPLVPEDA